MIATEAEKEQIKRDLESLRQRYMLPDFDPESMVSVAELSRLWKCDYRTVHRRLAEDMHDGRVAWLERVRYPDGTITGAFQVLPAAPKPEPATG